MTGPDLIAAAAIVAFSLGSEKSKKKLMPIAWVAAPIVLLWYLKAKQDKAAAEIATRGEGNEAP